MKLIIQFALLLLFFFFYFPRFSYAQVEQTGMAATQIRGSSVNYYYAKPGDLTITVSIWGFVQKPGLYEIASSTNLVHLLSLAGGPSNYSELDNVRIVRIIKENGDTKKIEFYVNLDDLTKLTKEQLDLKPGDIIYVDHNSWFTIKNVFSFATSIAVIITSTTSLIVLLR